MWALVLCVVYYIDIKPILLSWEEYYMTMGNNPFYLLLGWVCLYFGKDLLFSCAGDQTWLVKIFVLTLM
jgi:hypothetical protein